MILENLEIEFKGTMPKEQKEIIKDKICAFKEKIQTVGLNITGDKIMILFEVCDIAHIFSESLSDNVQIFFGSKWDRNFTFGERSVEISLSDNKKDFKQEDFVIDI